MAVTYEDGNYLTEKGRVLIAKCLSAQTEIKFTRAAVGTGTLADGEDPRDVIALSNWQADGKISDIVTPVPGEAQIIFQVFSQDVSIGFLATEAAIWATDPDEGDIVYTYIVIANNPEWIRASIDPVQKMAEFTCISIVESALVSSSQINPKAIVTIDALEQRLLSLNSGVEISEQDNPTTGTKLHLLGIKRVENWFRT